MIRMEKFVLLFCILFLFNACTWGTNISFCSRDKGMQEPYIPCGPHQLCRCIQKCMDCSASGLQSESLSDFVLDVNISSLSLTNNSLTSLPTTLFPTRGNLTKLQLDFNQFTKLPLQPLTSLRSTLTDLSINFNLITEVASSDFVGFSLTSLEIGSNKLTNIPSNAFETLPTLSTLSLFNLSLKTVPVGLFDYLPKLQELRLGLNGLETLHPSMFNSCPGLLELSLGNNSLTSIPPALKPLKKLIGLFLEYNRINTVNAQQVSQFRGTLEVFALKGNNIVTFPTDFFQDMTAMETLLLGSNKVTVFQDGLFDSLSALTLVDLSHNHITSIPMFPNSRRLEAAFFDGNHLAHLSSVSENINRMFQMINGETSLLKVPYMALADNPVICLFDTTTFSSFTCKCGFLYEFENGYCNLPAPPNHESQIIGGVFAGLIFGALIAGFVFSFKRVRTKMGELKTSLGLHEGLLQDRDAEVQELIQAWDIQSEEISLIRRIDVGYEGAFGEVWYGEWDGLGVAVKRLRSTLISFDSEAAKDFESEVDFLRRCRHRNIVRFFGAGNWNGVPFLVAEYLELGSLKKYLENESKENIPWNRKLGFCLDIQGGMQYLHTLGRLHRDLKTANCLLSKRLRCKVADFGSMKDIFFKDSRKEQLTRKNSEIPNINGIKSTAQDIPTHTVGVGTPLYMSPEVIRGASYGPSSDVWSFGIVMWEIGAQEKPELSKHATDISWKGPYMSCLERALMQGRRLPVGRDWPSGFAEVIAACNQIAPGARPTFSDLGSILEAMQDNFVGVPSSPPEEDSAPASPKLNRKSLFVVGNSGRSFHTDQ
eukprot:m.83848 g.83848  ORF g.83848 m.83848 type:complete len:823 (+) comp12940_c0_seq2:170-2638(+)